MKNILKITALFAVLGLTACGTTNTITTTKYDTEGNITEVILEEKDMSDFAAYINAGDGNATTLTGDISKFYLGYNGIGLSWFSASATRIKAPVKVDGSTSATVLKYAREVIKATKTTIETEAVSVNSSLKESEDAVAEEVENIEPEEAEGEGEEQVGETD